ncbi:MAG: leucine-rich repeat protein [Clostridium sp.]|nr:leucine-rich repeat protein [Clostridium sp.]
MRKFLLNKITVLLYCLIVFAGTLSMGGMNTAQAANTVTRAEWIHNLVAVFDMKIEDGLMPDDYYTDIAGSQYYNDILLAVNFGVIDLEAGQEFCPDDFVTREFAVQTLNACLGYELDEAAKYTMSDYAELKYPQAAQIAINEGWLQLVNGAFGPQKAVTITEKNNMINFAKNILKASVIEDEHKNIYQFANNVIEIPEETSVELLSNTEIMIYDTSLQLSKGDSIAVYSNGIAYTYKIVKLEEKADGIFVTGEEIPYEDAVVSVDAEGVIEADLGNFVPAEGVTVDVEYEEATAYGLETSGTKKIKNINLQQNVGGGTVSCKLTDLKISYRIDSKGYYFSTTGKATAAYTVSGSKSFTLNVGHISVAGVGKISVDMVYSASGSAALSYSYNFETGIEKNYGSATRKIKGYSVPTWHFSAKAELKTSCKVGFYVDVPGVANGSIYGEAGVKAEPETEIYKDGRKPTMCMDLPAYIFATVGYNVNVFGQSVTSETIQIYNQNNSPCRICYHIEDGNLVRVCSRPDSPSSVGKRGYYSTSGSGSGTYSGNCFVAPYSDVEEPTFEYELDKENNATITKYRGSVYCLTIPEELDGYPVVGIGDSAFKGNTYLGSVVIPDGVKTIGGNAFYSCSNLSSVTLSNKLVTINHDAFGKCNALVSIEIPKSINNCDANDYASDGGAFSYCDNLKTIYFEQGIKKIPKRLFYRCTGIEEIKIPDSVTTIEWRAFMKCTNLKKVTMADSVTRIEAFAFSYCTSLNDLQLSKSLIELWDDAFSYCNSLQSVEIPKSIETIKYDNGFHAHIGPFGKCENLKNIVFEEGIREIPNSLFEDCIGIRKIEIPKTVTIIKEKAFNGCLNLTEVILHDGLITIGSNVFDNCINLIDIDIPDSVNSMGAYIFSGCTSLQKAHLPDISINIAGGMFEGCTALTEVNFPETLETIGASAFRNCTSLTEVNLPNKVNTIYSGAFAGCTALTKVTISASVRKIENSAFFHCEALTDLKISEGTTSIGEYAFEYCIALEKATLPDTLQTLGNYAFSYCDQLSNINIGAGLKIIPNYCFYENPALINVILPQQVTAINKYAFGNCTGLTDITINRNVAAIDTTAFSYPEKLAIHGVAGTYAETFAKENDITFKTLDVQATGIKLNATELEVGRKESVQMTAAIIPADSSDDFTWTSTDEKIVSIDNTGKLTANALGKATVIAMVGNIVQTCEVRVYEPVTSVSLDKSSFTGTTGDTVQLTANVRPANATYSTVKWSSSDAEVAEVTSTGLVTLKKHGTATITVTTENKEKTAKCVITVQPISVTGVSLNSQTEILGIGDSCQLHVTITPANASVKDVTWTSSKPAVATVKNGEVTAVSEGTAVIIVKTKDGSKTASCTVTVKNVPVTGISLDKTELTLETKATQTISANILPVDATNTNVTWQSDNEEIASVVNGRITAKKAGTATITATTEDGKFSASCFVTVIGHGVTGITLSEKNLSIKEGNCALLEAMVMPENADDASVTWKMGDETIAAVDGKTGIVKGIKQGKTSITVVTTDGGYEATCEIEVLEADNTEKIKVSEVTIQADSEELSENNTIEVGKEFALTATVEPIDAANQNIFWISSDKNIALISQEGVVTTRGIGKVTFTAVSEDGAKCAELEVEVVPISVTGITLSSEKMEMLIGEENKLQVNIVPKNATNQDVLWRSNRRSVASVDAEGNIKANAVGTAVITVASVDGGYKDSCTITVKPILASEIKLDEEAFTMKVGDIKKIGAIVLPENTTNREIVWSSTNVEVAQVDEEGNISAIAEGTAGIVAAAADGSGVESQCVIHVVRETTEQSEKEQATVEDTLPATGTQVTIGNGRYKVTKSTPSVKEVTYIKLTNQKKTSITVPASVTIDGYVYKVTTIFPNALVNSKKITKVTVGKNVTAIGKNAFKNCKKLKSVTLKSTSLKTIGSSAFQGDKNLKTITIKSSKLTSKSIGKNAFKGTKKNLTIKVPKKKVKAYSKFMKKKGNKNIKVKK